MQSPVSNNKQMNRISLDENLTAYQCPDTEGIFLPVQSYVKWLSKQPERLPHLAANEESQEELTQDTAQVRICPESGQLMQRFRVGHGFSFYLDRSPSGSIWLDKGEWDALKSRNFHDELHLIFTAPWQAKIREQKREKGEESILKDRLGEDLYAQLNELKSKLTHHEYRELALSYLYR